MAQPEVGEHELPVIRGVNIVALDQYIIRFDVLVPPKAVSGYIGCITACK